MFSNIPISAHRLFGYNIMDISLTNMQSAITVNSISREYSIAPHSIVSREQCEVACVNYDLSPGVEGKRSAGSRQASSKP